MSIQKILCIISMFLLILLMFAGCKLPADTPDTSPSQVLDEPVPTSSSTENDDTIVPSVSDPTELDPTEAAVKESAPTIIPIPTEGPISVHTETQLQWTDDAGNDNHVQFRIPQIVPFSEDAIVCQKAIEDTYLPILEEASSAADNMLSIHWSNIDYRYYWNNGILSILIYQETNWDLTHYEVYNFSTETGAQLDNDALWELVMPSQGDWRTAVSAAAETAFAEKYAGIAADASSAIYQDYLKLSNGITGEMLESTQLFLDEDGRLCASVNLNSLAGAEYYPTLLPLTP